ncbi:MAG: 23S rRNA (guanosine(2251)-2'-O)-methyltransferase RlmB [Acidimicrobiaceae bacterium]|nr:23S rRNA (guanosine(2251)-2'-O)-methyltransferase RlmB [Acidimicrobiaceae bacterium]MXZ66020.1 23S rRNA (guanosine(2251)-2'-O)-methyltransferase RlmB [Acidimicrobiaceae bacterium]MYF35015.1 23S rRNA (guanosine(2251)-2'-O)-methyltransferase RlmB [Acidimicrobiaceae bacterium]MYG79090.1 23S rRNA (guanosine(2251)-2'-O)-methyltransferase RlmB [Acidimicrobiaceae bacterium]MYJ83626.1 23S rRNA (guanosine(2251)-2'-O)-methyltransferase RlmB [Acidimicrobiaceae bacterium]
MDAARAWPHGRSLWWLGRPIARIGPVPVSRPNRSRRPRPGPKQRSHPGRPGGGPRGPKSQQRDRGGLGGNQVEGRQAVRELLLAGRRRTRSVMLARGLDPAPIVEHIVELAREQRASVREVSRSELDATARTESPQGVVALADPLPEADLADLVGDRAGVPFLLALDGITDPGNFGAVLRTAECAGVTGVVLPRHRSARITPTVAKAAAGAIEHLRFAVVPGMPSALRTLSSHHVWTVGLDAAGPRPLHELELSGERVALVLGSEGRGLSRLVAQRCDVLASIPLRGTLGSLNVAAAAAVACFEIARRR